MQEVVLVVPSYNEELRLDGRAWLSLSREGDLGLLFVDDGSTDGTRRVLDSLAHESEGRIHVLALEKNSGKAEAVRRGLARALEAGASLVGYVDADLATPPGEILRLVRMMRDEPTVEVLLAARISRLGAEIARRPFRHYLGRVFATAASLVLAERVYDTQCGAKIFRRSEALVDAVNEPFLSNWAFDVELLGRLLTGSARVAPIAAGAFREVPLERWIDVAGSKLRTGAMVRTGIELLRIRGALAQRRATRAKRTTRDG